MTPVLTVTLFCPGKPVNVLNGSHRHWSVRAKWASAWRHTTQLAWLEAGRPTLDGPARVTFTVYVGRLFDDDALGAIVKPVRDQAVRLICQSGDGPGSGHSFSYKQERRSDLRGVLVEATPL
jgi:hypothetical protein